MGNDNSIFEEYLKKTTLSTETTHITNEELRNLENSCIDKLIELKSTHSPLYRYYFSKYGNDVCHRISYFNYHLDNGNDSHEVRLLKSSCERFRSNLRSLDRTLYEHELRSTIQKGKHQRKQNKAFTKPSTAQVTKQKSIVQEEIVPTNSFNLNLTKQQAESLYNNLLSNSCIEATTSESDFIYYFTGDGEPPKAKIKWQADAIILSIMIDILSNNRMPWKTIDNVFDGLNTSSMCKNLSKEKKKYNEGYQQCSYKTHREKILRWLNEPLTD